LVAVVQRRVVPAVLVLALLGCAEEDEPSVLGSPSDVKTEPGVYDGYEIIAECQHPSFNYGVRGTGSLWYNGVAPGDTGRFDALWDLASVVSTATRDVDSIFGVGIGTSCTLDSGGISVMTSDWRDVDRTFSLAGELLAERDLREEITLRVTGIPEPATGN
jgi:hypothetical protein